MENTIEYILYEREKNNEFINRLKPIDNAVKKIIKTKDGIKMEVFYNFSKYKNVRTLHGLSESLVEGEYLIIDLTEVQKRDNELYERIKETVDANNIIPYVYHTLEPQQKPVRAVGEKLYLIKFDDPIRSTIDIRNSRLVQLKVNPDQTCSCEGITFSSISKRQLDEELSYNYGGFSGLYYLIPEEEKENLETYYEITKIEDGKWDFIKKKKERNK